MATTAMHALVQLHLLNVRFAPLHDGVQQVYGHPVSSQLVESLHHFPRLLFLNSCCALGNGHVVRESEFPCFSFSKLGSC